MIVSEIDSTHEAVSVLSPTAKAGALRNDNVHMFVCLFVCSSV